MRVSISHHEKKKGLVFKKTLHEVWCAVEFSEEEKQIIKKNKYEKYVVMERKPPAGRDDDPRLSDVWHLRVGTLLSNRAEVYTLDDPVEAKVYEQQLTEALKDLKTYITASTEKAEDKTFEL